MDQQSVYVCVCVAIHRTPAADFLSHASPLGEHFLYDPTHFSPSPSSPHRRASWLLLETETSVLQRPWSACLPPCLTAPSPHCWAFSCWLDQSLNSSFGEFVCVCVGRGVFAGVCVWRQLPSLTWGQEEALWGVSSARRWKCSNPIYSHRHTLSDKYAPGFVTLGTHTHSHICLYNLRAQQMGKNIKGV